MDVSELVFYNDRVRSLYYGALLELSWEEVTKSKSLSFDSIRDVFLHLTLVEDRWVNYTLIGEFSKWKDPVFDDFGNFESLKAYMTRTHENTDKFLKMLKPEDYQNTVANPWIKGESISIETGLTHMVLECMVHFGELSAAFWQIGKEAPYLAFLRYELSKSK
ncbi:MAG TPA: DinB family protein [Candidatus Nanoarchaeia archaeon]|nr:DinB family protein [Candidatus Nanoarchaeia archaeon]